ncbi:hypothetical protein ACVJBD_005677 [Rhizobium mongolense]
MAIPHVIRLLNDVAHQVEVVGLGITEHLPWDALIIRDMRRQLPLIGKDELRGSVTDALACHGRFWRFPAEPFIAVGPLRSFYF